LTIDTFFKLLLSLLTRQEGDAFGTASTSPAATIALFTVPQLKTKHIFFLPFSFVILGNLLCEKRNFLLHDLAEKSIQFEAFHFV